MTLLGSDDDQAGFLRQICQADHEMCFLHLVFSEGEWLSTSLLYTVQRIMAGGPLVSFLVLVVCRRLHFFDELLPRQLH